jgi:hypothetical protein
MNKTFLPALLCAALVAHPARAYEVDASQYCRVINWSQDPTIQRALRMIPATVDDIAKIVKVYEAWKRKDGTMNVMLMCQVQFRAGLKADDGTQFENDRVDYNEPGLLGPNEARSVYYDSGAFQLTLNQGAGHAAD